MHTISPRQGLLPLAPCEPDDLGAGPQAPDPALEQLSLDDLLAEIPSQRAGISPRTDLEYRKLHHLLTAFLEMHAGRRPVGQLTAWLTPALQGWLRERARTSGPRYTVGRVHVCRPADGVIELCGTAHAAGRASAVTARFEHRRDGWRCSAFTVLEPTASRSRS